LTCNQWTNINSILTNPDYYTISQKQIVKSIIYDNYKIWASNQAIKFKKFHYYKCRHISIHEFILYSQIGLHKAVINYNPLRLKNITFSSYAYIYIRGEFYKCVTELYPITSVSKYERRKGRNTRNNKTIIDITSFSNIYQELCFNNYVVKQYHDKNQYLNYNDLWLKIEHDTPTSILAKKIIKLKFSYEFKQQRSNKQISEIIGCSEETIRQHVVEFKHALTNLQF
jgi:DNA-directed RNA polymerase specialized sigma subunit